MGCGVMDTFSSLGVFCALWGSGVGVIGDVGFEAVGVGVGRGGWCDGFAGLGFLVEGFWGGRERGFCRCDGGSLAMVR